MSISVSVYTRKLTVKVSPFVPTNIANGIIICGKKEKKNPHEFSQSFSRVSGNKPGKMVFVGVGYGSILYFNLRGHRNLYSWDTKSNLLEENIKMVRESRDCRTITHVDVDNEGTLWILESNIQDFINDRTGCYGPSILLTSVREAPAVPITDEFNT